MEKKAYYLVSWVTLEGQNQYRDEIFSTFYEASEYANKIYNECIRVDIKTVFVEV